MGVAQGLKRLDARTMAWGAAIAVVLAMALWLMLPRMAQAARFLAARRRQRRKAYAASEAAARRDLLRVLKKEDVAAVVSALYRWLDRSGALPPEAERFLAAFYGSAGEKPDFTALRATVSAWRGEKGESEGKRNPAESRALAQLNPPSHPLADNIR